MQLATSAQIDNIQATNLVAGALNSFSLSGRDAVKVADLLTGAAKESQGEITDMGTALAQAAAVSNQFGVSIEDTVTLLTVLAQAGIAGGRAGTSLRVAFLRLVNPPADAAKALKELNVQIRDADGNLRPQIFTDIQKALQGYTKAQQDATLATIFGADAIRTAGIVGAKGADAFNETRDAITQVGLAQENAAARTQGFQGDVENLSNQVSGLGLTLGNIALGPASAFVKSLADMAAQANLAADGAVALGAKVGDLGRQVSATIPFFDKFATGFGFLKTAAELSNPLTLSLKTASEAAKAFGVDTEDAGKKGKAFGNIALGIADAIDALTGALDKQAAQQKPAAFEPLNVRRILNRVQGFDSQQVRDKIAGDNAKLLSDLQAEQTFLQQQLQSDAVKRRPALQRALEQSLFGVVTDIRAIQAKAKAAQDALKAEAERNAKETAKTMVDAANTVESGIRRAAEIIRSAAKKNKVTAAPGGGFSLADLFRSATDNFNTFGSNIAARNGVLSAQDARGSLAGNILAQIGTSQLTEAQKQTVLLGQIDSNTRPGAKAKATTGSSASSNNWQSFRDSFQAANNGYGRF